MLPPKQSGIIKQTRFTYSPHGNAIEEQVKTVEEKQEKKKNNWRCWKKN